MKNWFLWFVAGVLSICAGVMAFANPLSATLTVEQLVGWSFLILGVLQVISAFRSNGSGSRTWAVLAGGIGIILGFVLIAKPFAGVVALTVMVAILLLVLGLTKIFMSFSLRGTSYFLPVLISGILSLILAVMIFSDFPGSAAVLLGVMLAVELISNGVALIALSLRQKSIGKSPAAATA